MEQGKVRGQVGGRQGTAQRTNLDQVMSGKRHRLDFLRVSSHPFP